MADPVLHLPDGDLPLVGWRRRPPSLRASQESALPEVTLTVGRDLRSTGATLSVWEPTGGQFPRCSTLWASRWAQPLVTTEDAVRIALQAMTAAVAELFGPDLSA